MPVVLAVFWGLSGGAAVFALLPGRWAPAFKEAVYLSACRGKLWEGKPSVRLGWLTAKSVPQHWFAHFYAVGVACNTAVLLGLLLFPTVSAASFTFFSEWGLSCLALVLLEVHLMRRLAETVLLMHYPPNARMHLIAYVFGMSYYLVLPLSCLSKSLYHRVGEDTQWQSPPCWTEPFRTAVPELIRALRPHAWQAVLATCIFLLGNGLQHHSHRILASLRPDSSGKQARGQADGTDYYKLPMGGGFEYVSCPHYLGEIIIYAGLLVLLGPQRLLPWLMLTWVVANLLLAAGPTHRWYRRRFKQYPSRRRAIIPFLY
ncbi:hypothetical protein WJX72_010154 [[Myrmecia] bisecta]|uniref:3-oxo-5-alpha-steroid 4-dehydrogenase C-terminal domain-containing protein n=1 Tax=[Myrmecia] bisecta TaxID=41462 RepID=A0AAW1PQU1_9CHLO